MKSGQINHLHSGLPRGTKLISSGTMSDAAFDDPDKLRSVPGLKYSDGKLFLGLLDAEVLEERNPVTQRLTRHAIGGQAIGLDDDRHMITVAGSRSGKGVSAIIPNLLSYSGSVLAIDPKAELATICARRRTTELGQPVHVLDPFNKARGHAKTLRRAFNPMDFLKRDSETLVEDAGLISDALITPSGGDSHWDESAQNFIEGVILHVATASKYEGKRNLITVYRLIMEITSGILKDEMDSNPACEDAVRDAARNFFEKQDKERDSVLSTIRRNLRFLGYKNMQSVLTHSDFDLADLKRKPMTVFLCLPAMRMGTCFRWFRLFINLTLARMEEITTKPESPVLMCLDEFAVLGHMKTIEDAAGQIAGFGVRLWPILQDLGQLKSLYKDRWETFMGNAGTLQFFGNSDMTTLEWISKRLGETTVNTISKSGVTYQQRTTTDATGESSSVHSHALLTPEEISRFFGREDRLQRQLIIRAGFNPMILQKVCYYRDPRFKKQFDSPPSEQE